MRHPFNPTLVRLKQVSRVSIADIIDFQSYLSSIKTQRLRCFCAARVAFQSYLSSIKTTSATEVLLCLAIFQSYLSSIKTFKDSDSVPPGIYFQSYLSSIKTNPGASPTDRLVKAFNPTLVRLKLDKDSRNLFR